MYLQVGFILLSFEEGKLKFKCVNAFFIKMIIHYWDILIIVLYGFCEVPLYIDV